GKKTCRERDGFRRSAARSTGPAKERRRDSQTLSESLSGAPRRRISGHRRGSGGDYFFACRGRSTTGTPRLREVNDRGRSKAVDIPIPARAGNAVLPDAEAHHG